MKHLLTKKSLTLFGAGGGGASAPPPATITQYPAVLVPPQMGDAQSISSFSYAEIIDLICDGPIEGLVNHDGNKVVDENIFEGMYFNDVPIKETSRVNFQKISITSLKDSLKSFWGSANLFVNQTISSTIYTDDILFSEGISLQSWHPDSSVQAFVDNTTKNQDSVAILQRAMDLCPVSGQKAFLTLITIPKFVAYVSADKFDSTEGGQKGEYPLKLSIPNISNHIYFDVGHESLNQFNYFEMPRSFAENPQVTDSGKKTFAKSLLSSDADYLKYEIYNARFFVWSVFDAEVGIKNVDKILDNYFKHLYIYQHNASLYNYNLVQSEFNSGGQIQAPLKNFASVEIDNQYDRSLVGPFRLVNTTGHGVQRVTTLCKTPSTNVTLEQETSDDIRYVKSWPVEYDGAGNPFLICNLCANYASFDKTSATRTCQDAVPVTHYIANQNVECAYVTLNLTSLYDTAHVDLITNNAPNIIVCCACLLQTGTAVLNKYNNTDPTYSGSKTYSQLAGATDYQGNIICSKYFLVYGNSVTDGYVLDAANTCTGVFENIRQITGQRPLYYDAISSSGLAPAVSGLTGYIGCSYYLPVCGLDRYLVPNNLSLCKNSFKINQYTTDLTSLESRLKLTNPQGEKLYCFGMIARDTVAVCSGYNDVSAFSVICTCLNQLNNANVARASALGICTTNRFFASKINYYAVSTDELKSKAAVATILDSYIDWDSLFSGNVGVWNNSTKRLTRPDKDFSSVIISNLPSSGDRLRKLINKFLSGDPVSDGGGNWYLSVTSFISANTIIGFGINRDWIFSNPSFFNGAYLTPDALESILQNYSIDYYGFNSNLDVTDESVSLSFKNALNNLQSDLVASNIEIFSIRNYPISNASSTYFTDSGKQLFNPNKAYLHSTINLGVDDNYDVLLIYKIFVNSTISSANSLGSAQTYSRGNSDGSTRYADFSQAVQQITAGTKLPAVVSVKVETGYESTEEDESVGPNDYYSYQYDIYGVSASEGALIDIGRKSYDSVVAKKTTSNFGTFLTTKKNIYYENNSLYLFEISKYVSGVQDVAPRYFLKDKKIMSAPDFDQMNFYYTVDNTGIGISYLTGVSGETLGLQKQAANISAMNTAYSNLFSGTGANGLIRYEVPLCSLNTGIPSVPDYFDAGFKILNIATAMPLLRCTGLNNTTLIGSSMHPVDSYIESSSVDPLNTANKSDSYRFYVDGNNYIQANIYSFQYSAYETILPETTTSATVLDYLNFPYSISFYLEMSESGETFLAKAFLTKPKANEIVLEYDYSSTLNGETFTSGSYRAIRMIVRIVKNDTTIDPARVQQSLDDAFTTNALSGHNRYTVLDADTILNFLSANPSAANDIVAEMRKVPNFLPAGLTFNISDLVSKAGSGAIALQNKMEVSDLNNLHTAITYLNNNPSSIIT